MVLTGKYKILVYIKYVEKWRRSVKKWRSDAKTSNDWQCGNSLHLKQLEQPTGRAAFISISYKISEDMELTYSEKWISASVSDPWNGLPGYWFLLVSDKVNLKLVWRIVCGAFLLTSYNCKGPPWRCIYPACYIHSCLYIRMNTCCIRNVQLDTQSHLTPYCF